MSAGGTPLNAHHTLTCVSANHTLTSIDLAIIYGLVFSPFAKVCPRCGDPEWAPSCCCNGNIGLIFVPPYTGSGKMQCQTCSAGSCPRCAGRDPTKMKVTRRKAVVVVHAKQVITVDSTTPLL